MCPQYEQNANNGGKIYIEYYVGTTESNQYAMVGSDTEFIIPQNADRWGTVCAAFRIGWAGVATQSLGSITAAACSINAQDFSNLDSNKLINSIGDQMQKTVIMVPASHNVTVASPLSTFYYRAEDLSVRTSAPYDLFNEIVDTPSLSLTPVLATASLRSVMVTPWSTANGCGALDNSPYFNDNRQLRRIGYLTITITTPGVAYPAGAYVGTLTPDPREPLGDAVWPGEVRVSVVAGVPVITLATLTNNQQNPYPSGFGYHYAPVLTITGPPPVVGTVAVEFIVDVVSPLQTINGWTEMLPSNREGTYETTTLVNGVSTWKDEWSRLYVGNASVWPAMFSAVSSTTNNFFGGGPSVYGSGLLPAMANGYREDMFPQIAPATPLAWSATPLPFTGYNGRPAWKVIEWDNIATSATQIVRGIEFDFDIEFALGGGSTDPARQNIGRYESNGQLSVQFFIVAESSGTTLGIENEYGKMPIYTPFTAPPSSPTGGGGLGIVPVPFTTANTGANFVPNYIKIVPLSWDQPWYPGKTVRVNGRCVMDLTKGTNGLGTFEYGFGRQKSSSDNGLITPTLYDAIDHPTGRTLYDISRAPKLKGKSYFNLDKAKLMCMVVSNTINTVVSPAVVAPATTSTNTRGPFGMLTPVKAGVRTRVLRYQKKAKVPISTAVISTSPGVQYAISAVVNTIQSVSPATTSVASVKPRFVVTNDLVENINSSLPRASKSASTVWNVGPE